MNNTLHLVSIDIGRIQSFILETSKLREIIGASWIIDDLNLNETIKILKNCGTGNADYKNDEVQYNGTSIFDNKLDWELIFTGGGNTKVLFSDETKAKVFAREIAYAYNTRGIANQVLIEPWDITTKCFVDVDKVVNQKMRFAKNAIDKDFVLTTSPFFKVCNSCGKRPAEETQVEDSRTVFLCRVCHQKRQTGKDISFPYLRGFIQSPLGKSISEDDDFSDDLSKIADQKNGYIAVVAIDGNQMGEKIESLLKKAKSDNKLAIRLLRKFSSELYRLTTKCLAGAVVKCFNAAGAMELRTIRFRPLIIGGDDLLFVIEAGKCFELVQSFCQNLTEQSKNIQESDIKVFDKDGITVSAGIALVKHNFPFSVAYHLAEGLLKNAKQMHRQYLREKKQDVSVVDYHIVTTSSVDSISEIRRREYEYIHGQERHRLTAKPYVINPTDDKADLQSLITNAKNMRKFVPNNKIKQLREVLRTGRLNSKVEIAKMYSRLREVDQQEFRKILTIYADKRTNDLIWNLKQIQGEDVYVNNLFDMIELTGFLKD